MPTSKQFFYYAKAHLFGAKRLVDGLLAEATAPYVVNQDRLVLLVRPIGLLMGLGVELMLKGCVANHGPVPHVHSLNQLLALDGGKQFLQLLDFHARQVASAFADDPDLLPNSKITPKDAPELVRTFIQTIDELHSKGGNLYRYGGEGKETPHAPFLVEVLWSTCSALDTPLNLLPHLRELD